jgi:hypothetical protein
MISSKNKPTNELVIISDFTTDNYRKILKIADNNYRFVFYNNIPIGSKFVLWRHDLDFSINRAYELGKIEKEQNVYSTYFINPHSEFYNPFEMGQSDLINKILDMGHKLGLHFDAAYYDVSSEKQLNQLVTQEANLLGNAFCVRPEVFSFHNPTEFLLTCENDHYGGLINTYSKWFKENVPYCSDSNGYWRFRRLQDVLEEATDSCLQILTHPGWWQDEPMMPRDRVLRSIEARAKNVIDVYDKLLKNNNRKNI